MHSARPPQSLEITHHPPKRGGFHFQDSCCRKYQTHLCSRQEGQNSGRNRSIGPLKNACASKRRPRRRGAAGTDRRMFIQPCLFHDQYHVGCVRTFLMTVIVEAAQVEKKNVENTTKQWALIKRTCAAGLLLSSVYNDGWSNVMKSDAHCCAYL